MYLGREILKSISIISQILAFISIIVLESAGIKTGQVLVTEPQKWLRTEVLSHRSLWNCVCHIPNFCTGGLKKKKKPYKPLVG